MENIKGTYSPKEAKEILLKMIDAEIDFHNIKNLSSQVKYNRPDANAQERINALKNTKNELLQLIAEAKEASEKLTFHTSISLASSSQKISSVA